MDELDELMSRGAWLLRRVLKEGDPDAVWSSLENCWVESDEAFARRARNLSYRWGRHRGDAYGREELHRTMLEALKYNQGVFDTEAAAGKKVEMYRVSNARAQGTVYGQMFRCRELIRDGYVSKLRGF